MACARCGCCICTPEDKIILNKQWHKRCFNCYTCRKPLCKDTANICLGEIFCVNCTPSCDLEELQNCGCETILKPCKICSSPSNICIPKNMMNSKCGTYELIKCGNLGSRSCSCIPDNKTNKVMCYPIPREVANFYSRNHQRPNILDNCCTLNETQCACDELKYCCPNKCKKIPKCPIYIAKPCNFKSKSNRCKSRSCSPKKSPRKLPLGCCPKKCECSKCCRKKSPRHLKCVKSPLQCCFPKSKKTPCCCGDEKRCSCLAKEFTVQHKLCRKDEKNECGKQKAFCCYCGKKVTDTNHCQAKCMSRCVSTSSDTCVSYEKCKPCGLMSPSEARRKYENLATCQNSRERITPKCRPKNCCVCPPQCPPRKSRCKTPCCKGRERSKSPFLKCKKTFDVCSCPNRLKKFETPECLRCHQKVYAAEKILVRAGAYHNSCFSCHCCNKLLDIRNVYEGCGEIFCRQCYNNFFGVRYYGFVPS